jgi:hypothetical protein
MGIFCVVANKVALWLTARESKTFSSKTADFLIHCCDFHGCGNYRNHKPCGRELKEGKPHTIATVL